MMETFNIHDAKTHLSRLVDRAVNGEPFVIAKAGKPMVLVIRYEPTGQVKPKRTGFLNGQISVPDDFDSLGQTEIEQLFCGHE
jgi:prevent-host-death family protein